MGTFFKKLFAASDLLGVLLKLLPADAGAQLVAVAIRHLKVLADDLLDRAEEAIADSDTTLDDRFLIPAISRVRDAFNIPDNDVPLPDVPLPDYDDPE